MSMRRISLGRRLLAIAVAAGTAVAGCRSPAGPVDDGSPPIRTAAASYALRVDARGVEVEIHYEFTNRTTRPIYMVRCIAPHHRLEKLVDGVWVRALDPPRFGCIGPPIRVDPQWRFATTMAVFGGAADCSCGPVFEVDDPTGTFRIVIDGVVFDYDDRGPPWGVPLALDQRVSNPFTLRAPDG